MVQRTQILELVNLVVDTKLHSNSQSRELLMGYKSDNIWEFAQGNLSGYHLLILSKASPLCYIVIRCSYLNNPIFSLKW